MSLQPVLAAVFLVTAAAATAPAQQIDNAVIVVIDGIRNDEAFESESLYLKRIWNDLRPLGTINTRFWNRGMTVTTGAHTTILSGVRQVLPNNGDNSQDIRGYDPLLFECYRKYTGEPQSACGVIVGKWGNVGAICDFGLEPGFGWGYRAFQLGWGENGTADTACSRLVHRAMDSLHPRLLLVNLGDVDGIAHVGQFEPYVEAIRVADSIVYDLYRHIQAIPPYADTFYRDRTLLIVTTDHGRRDDAHGGFRNHGQWDHSSRHVMFYAFGPGVAAGRTIDSVVREDIDIAPTIGAALGFPVPFAEGEVMTELFESGCRPRSIPAPGGAPVSAQNLSNDPGFSRDPDVCPDRYGGLHLVWSDNTSGRWSVLYSRSTDDGMSWSAPRTMFDYPAAESVMWYARVAADDSLAVAATGYGRHLCCVDSLEPVRVDTTFIWYPWVAASTDRGNTWSTTSLLDSSMGTYYPAVSVRSGRYSVAWSWHDKYSWEGYIQGVSLNHRTGTGAWESLPGQPSGLNASHIALADRDSSFQLVASVLNWQNWDIGYYTSSDGDSWSREWVVYDLPYWPVYDYDPELVVDDSGVVHAVWARKEDVGGDWRVMYGRREPAGAGWDTVSLVVSGGGAWQPHIARKGDTLAVVWIDYRDGTSEVYVRFSPDRGLTWSDPQPVTSARTLTQHPRVCAAGSGFYVVWQSMAGGNWDVYGELLAVQVGLAGEARRAKCAPSIPTVVRGVLRTGDSKRDAAYRAELLDAAGRKVMELRPGANDVVRLAPGVYFVHASGDVRAARVVVAR